MASSTSSSKLALEVSAILRSSLVQVASEGRTRGSARSSEVACKVASGAVCGRVGGQGASVFAARAVPALRREHRHVEHARRFAPRLDGINSGIIQAATAKAIEKLLAEMQGSPASVGFSDALKVAKHYFGEPRNSGSSHYVFKTPWAGDPRINLQKAKGGRAKPYQVRQLLAAIEKLELLKAPAAEAVGKSKDRSTSHG
ncbi:MAG TPA: hypothetical protein VKI44_03575 [Acetobacteraceae bacterium]|nr:hypothetical protein [Acetobacteraceae bacterium]